MALSYDADSRTSSLIAAVTDKVKAVFPVEGKLHTLEVQDVQADKEWDPKNIEGQMQAKLMGRTWGVPIVGTVVVRDKTTGKTLDRREGVRLLTLPVMTRHYSYVVEGKEYDVTRQFRLKAGVYNRVKANGQIESQWNLAEGRGFHTEFDPASRKMSMSYGSSTVGLYPVIKALGATDADIRKAWGPEVFQANANENPRDLPKLAKIMTGTSVGDERSATMVVRETFEKTLMRGDVNQETLGHPHTRVDSPSLLAASGRLLAISQGKAQPDPRDSIVFKEMLDIDDFLGDRISAMTKRIQGKVRNRLDRGGKVDEVFSADYFNRPVQTFFSTMSLAETSRQVNPIDIFGSMTKTTIMGEGGIQSAHGVPIEARLLENSHVGFLDPVHSPEGSRTGISLHLALAAGKRGREPTTLVREKKTGKLVEMTASELYNKVVAFPDQFIRQKNGSMIPVSKQVAAIGAGNEMVRVDPKDVDYITPNPKAVFSITANLIPFLSSNSGPRVSYGDHHMEQALALKHREQPLIAASTGSETGPRTFEDLVGGYFTVKSPVDGKVVRVTDKEVVLRGADGKLHKEPLYDRYPLNEKSAYLQSVPSVKAGDVVKQGDTLAEEIHTKDGQLALGVNLKVGYFPYLSDTYDDAIAISEACAEKLTSMHLYKEALDVEEGVSVDKKRYRAMYRDRLNDAQAAKLDDDGVVAEGTIVQPDDVLVAALKVRTATEEEMSIKGIGKSLVRPYSDISVRWDSQYPGKVTRVVKQAGRIQVHVETEEPAGVGDKLCYDGLTEVLTSRGWLPFSELTIEDSVLTYHAPDDCSHRRSTADGYVEWQRPTRLVQFGFQGNMYCVRTADVDLRVTPDHNMFVKLFGRKHQEVRQNRFQLVTAKRIAGKRVGYAIYAANRDDTAFPEWVQYRGEVLPARSFLTVLAHVYRADSTTLHRAPAELTAALDECKLKYALRLGEISRPSLAITDKLLKSAVSAEPPKFLDDLPTEDLRRFLKKVFQTRADLTSGEHRGTVYLVHKVTRAMLDRYLELGVRARLAFDVAPVPNSSLYQIQLRMFPSFRPPCTVEVNNVARRPDDWWESTGDGTEQVYCCTVPNGVLVVRRNWKVVLSGNSGRHGNKGVVSVVIPTEDMPRTADGPLDIILNPLGVPSRINVGAPLETSLAKVADKAGEQIAVSSFEADPSKRMVHVKGHYRTVKTADGEKKVYIEAYSYERDYTAGVASALKAAEISEEEEVFDPVSGKSIGKVLVGKQYTIKHVHQSEKKLAARSGGPGYDYDANMAPKSSGHSSGQSMGELGLYGLLSHGAVNLIREGATIKSDAKQDDVWTAIQTGEPLPAPKPSFAYGKFLALLASMGVNVDKSGSQLSLRPLTDDDVKLMSKGELTNPTLMLRAKDLKPEEGGLFDEKVTGGTKGDRWCFVYDTLVETDVGPVRIGDVVTGRMWWLKIQSYNFATQRVVYRTLSGIYRKQLPEATGEAVYTHPMLGVTRLVGTPEHRVLTESGSKIRLSAATTLFVESA